MKRIVLTESQYKRLVSQKLNEEITLTGEKISDFDIDLEGNIVRRWSDNNPEHVERIQRMLKSLDYELGPYGPNKDGVDGIYGPFTEDAVKEFQEDEMPGQPDQHDGVMGPITYSLLKSKVDEKSEEEGVEVDTMLSMASMVDGIGKDKEDDGIESIDDYLSKKDPMVKGKNGNLSLDDLTYIGKDADGNDEYLTNKAALWFNKMKEDAKKEGVTIEISDAYRPCGKPGDYERYKKEGIRFTQWAAWEQYKFNPKMAAKPNPPTAEEWNEEGGYCTSNHGLGKAVDVNGWKARKWVKKNGEKYGFHKYKAEKWHFDFKDPEPSIDIDNFEDKLA